ncbi:MAG: 4-hydroxythreonine-4-phosphate dehydrogenase PdxA [bacterium]
MKIIFTIGDCNGIGLEVLIKALIKFDDFSKSSSFDKLRMTNSQVDFSIVGNEKTIKEYLSYFNFPITVNNNTIELNNRKILIIKSAAYSPVQFGKETKSAGRLAAKSIEKALALTLKNQYDAMITMPVSKSVLYKAGWKYPGHTEMLADVCNVKNPLMLLCTDKIRVGLATIHIPLSKVHKSITKSGLIETAQKFNLSLKQDFGIKAPKIALLGLNPHAGESGDIGKEEIKIIIPAINELNKQGIKTFGPFPADGFFAHGEYKQFHGILAMYHDQGLIPLKLLAKGSGVNFTAGLPIVRTSPDHGTAFGIAGQNKADCRSTLHAIELAIEVVRKRRKI